MVWLHPSDWYCVALIIDGNNTQCSRDAHIYADIKYKRSETNGIIWTDSIESAPARLLVAGVRPDPDRGNWCDSWWEINAVNQTAWPPPDLRISHCNIAYPSSYPGYISLWCCYVLDFLRVSVVSYNCNNTLSPINSLRPKQIAAILKTFFHAFSWTKMFEMRLRFHWILFRLVPLRIHQHWFW